MDLDGVELDLAVDPFAWSGGSLVLDQVNGVGVAGPGVCAHASGASCFRSHLDLLPPVHDGESETCRLYCSVPGPLKSVQQDEIWECTSCIARIRQYACCNG